MNQVIKEIYLNLDKTNDLLPIVTAKQGDNARDVIINLLSGSSTYAIASTTTARIAIKKPDNTQILKDCSISNNKIYASLTMQTLATSGQAISEIQLIDSSDNAFLSTPAFLLRIEPSNINSNGIESSEEFTSLQNALLTVGNIENKLDKTGNASNTSVDFTIATTETDIASGENLSTIFGKIIKSISSFRTSIAGKIDKVNIINNFTVTDPSLGLVPNATTVKQLKDNVDTINTSLTALTPLITPTFTTATANTATINSGFTYGSTVSKIGNQMTARLIASAYVFTAGNGTYYWTLPAGYRPSSMVAGKFIGKRRGGTDILVYGAFINANGQVYQNFNSDGNTYLWDGEFYFVFSIV